MTLTKSEAMDVLSEMEEVMEQLMELREKAAGLIRQLPSDMRANAEAYRVVDFGTSCNPYDTTFEKVIKHLEARIDDGGFDADEDEESED